MEEKKETIQCINCSEEISGDYCLSCGQPARPERLTMVSLWSDYFGRVFNLDTKFLRTVKDLTLDPGRVSREFVLGNRVKYVPPVSYFVILSTLFILFLSVIDVKYSDVIATTQQVLNPTDIDDKGIRMQQMFNEEFVKYLRTFFFLQIPFIALFGKILFKKSGYNFVENGFLAFYTSGHLIWLTIIGVISFKISGSALNALNSLASAVYFSWACVHFYNGKPVKTFFKGLLLQFFALLTFMLFIILLLLLALVIYIKFVDPKFLDSI